MIFAAGLRMTPRRGSGRGVGESWRTLGLVQTALGECFFTKVIVRRFLWRRLRLSVSVVEWCDSPWVNRIMGRRGDCVGVEGW